MKMLKTLFACALFLIPSMAMAQQGLEMDLWPTSPKTSNGDPNDQAKVTVFLPEKKKATGRAILICPGGGYHHLAFEKEGTLWAPYFNAQGIAVIVLKYRMPHGVSNVPREDAEEAMRLIRRMSEAWNINTSDVGIMGFSAGGHLASTIATHSKGDAAPNFQILFYPVITMEAGVTHQGSLLAHNDKSVSPLNSIGYYEELCHHKVPTSLHIYPEGGHGFGILESFPNHYELMTELREWLRSF